QVWELNRSIGPKFDSVFQRLDFKPFQRFRAKSSKLEGRIERLERSLYESRLPFQDDEQSELRLLEHTLYPTDEVLELHQDVFEELERVDVLDLVKEVQESLPRIPPRYLLPLVDAAGNFGDGEWFEKPWHAERHRILLNEVIEQREALAHLW